MPCIERRGVVKPIKRRKLPKERDESRFNCPYPGCDRSCAELWRLKVHFRAPPDNKGSGVERGHNAELEFCPRCNQKLEAGKHHIGCRSGLAAPRQALKREERNQAEARGRRTSARLTQSTTEAAIEVDIKAQNFASSEVSQPATPPSVTIKQEQPSLSEASNTTAVGPPLQPHGGGPFPLTGTQAQLPQLQRSSSSQSETSQHTQAVDPMVKLGQGLSFIGPFVDTTLLECEIDEEVFIPKSFSPLLEGGIGGNLQLQPAAHGALHGPRAAKNITFRPFSSLLNIAACEANVAEIVYWSAAA